jgi:LemA protein
MGKGGKIVLVALIVLALWGISYFISTGNKFVRLDQGVNSQWAQVQNVYQRRFDLIPNLVETVKGYASHERQTLQAVTEARAKVGGVTNLRAEDLTQENLARFQEAQAGLSGALQRLMVVVEQYPNLKANENFIRLQDELANTENRISQERRRFNEVVQDYNTAIKLFPASLVASMRGFAAKSYFEAPTEAQQAPKVQF